MRSTEFKILPTEVFFNIYQFTPRGFEVVNHFFKIFWIKGPNGYYYKEIQTTITSFQDPNDAAKSLNSLLNYAERSILNEGVRFEFFL